MLFPSLSIGVTYSEVTMPKHRYELCATPTADELASYRQVRIIRDHILQHGGTDISAPIEWIENPEPEWYWSQWMDPLLTRGALMPPGTHGVHEEPMLEKVNDQSQCHKNATTLFLRKQVNSFATGFALFKNGIWCHHSWGIRTAGREDVLVETIGEAFDNYFGVRYEGTEGVQRAKGLYNAVSKTQWTD
jgi:hypothetical protein